MKKHDDVIMDKSAKKEFSTLLMLRRMELYDDLENNDYSAVQSVEDSIRQQIDCIGILLEQILQEI